MQLHIGVQLSIISSLLIIDTRFKRLKIHYYLVHICVSVAITLDRNRFEGLGGCAHILLRRGINFVGKI